MNSHKTRKTIATIVLSIFLISPSVKAQQNTDYHTEIELQAIGTSGNAVPFWMRSNQFGSIPLKGISGSGLIRTSKDFSKSQNIDGLNTTKKMMDWGYGFEARVNGGNKADFHLLETYVKGKISIFQLKLGRSKDVMGLNGDTALSSGNFAVSGNALGIPKIELSIPEYWRLPFFHGIFSIKGTFSHGWIGRTRILDSIRSLPPANQIFYIKNNRPETYFHQKSFYMKLGQEDWKLNLFGGFSHQVFWGNEQEAYGSNFKLSSLETFLYVLTGKAYGAKGVPTSKIGNQLGSIDVGADYKFDKIKIMLYRQNFYDVGALAKLANIADGLNGIAVENLNYSGVKKGFQLRKALFELFYSKDQAGYPWSTPTKSGDEDYYNNFYYMNGWSYYGRSIGSPLITTEHDAKPGQVNNRFDYFINNRVIAIHGGLSGSVNNIEFTTKLSYSWNSGTFSTSKYGSSTGIIRNGPASRQFEPVQQFSAYISASKHIFENYTIGFATAVDSGELLNNSFGILFNLKKTL